MNTKTMFSSLTFVILTISALGGFEENYLVDAVSFGDHMAGGGGPAPGPEKEAIPNYLNSVVNCKLGNPHKRFPECRCGERVEIVPESDILDESLGDYHVRIKQSRKGKRRFIYYHCLFCSQCPDGVRTLSHCSMLVDTQCTTSCIKPTHYFDQGRKACVPDPRLEADLTTQLPHVTEPQDVEQFQNDGQMPAGGRPLTSQSLDNGTPNGSSSKQSVSISDEKYILIAFCALIVVVFIVLIINLFTCRFFYQRRKNDQESESMISRSSSRASMPEAPAGVNV